MRIYLIDDEEKFMRRLARRTFAFDFMTTDDKAAIAVEKAQKKKDDSARFLAMLNEIKANKCRTGETIKRSR